MNIKDRKVPSIFGSAVMIARFMTKVVINENGCHEWTGTRHSNGYGQMRIDGKAEYAHRLAWRLAGRQIPEGLQVLHDCDNRRCVAIDHLYIGTQRKNIADAKARGRMGSNGIGEGIKPWRPVPEWRRPW